MWRRLFKRFAIPGLRFRRAAQLRINRTLDDAVVLSINCVEVAQRLRRKEKRELSATRH